MLKRILLIGFVGCLLALPSPVQGRFRISPGRIKAACQRAIPNHFKRTAPTARSPKLSAPKPKNANSSTRNKKPSFRQARQNLRTLNARMERTTHQALKTEANTDHFSMLEGPFTQNTKFTTARHFSAKRMYPDKPFLQHPVLGPSLAKAYFIAQSNRLFARYLREMDHSFWPAFEAAKPRFIEEAEAFARELEDKGIRLEQTEDIATWTANQISPEVKNLFIGEVHGQYEIPQFVNQLLPLLREQNPDREIFLFTEFLLNLEGKEAPLSEKEISSYCNHYRSDLWKTVEQLNIPLIGLESKSHLHHYLLNEAFIYGYTPILQPAEVAPDAIRMRNEHWCNILQKYRAENPNALFVIYAGSGHTLYNRPLSLSKRFPKETTLTLDLTMDKVYRGTRKITRTDALERLDPHLSFPQPVIQWSSPDLIELSGFDIRIKLPNIPKPKEILEIDQAIAKKLRRQYRWKRWLGIEK